MPDVDLICTTLGTDNRAEVQGIIDAIEETRVWKKAHDLNGAIYASPLAALPVTTWFDSQYLVIRRDVWDRINALMWEHKAEYIIDQSDCDKYAMSFCGDTALLWKVNSAGLVIDYSGHHAYNVVVTYESDPDVLEAKVLEPQGEYWVPGSWLGVDPYTETSGQIMF